MVEMTGIEPVSEKRSTLVSPGAVHPVSYTHLNTKVVVNALEQDVTMYWIVQSGKEDDIIENLLSKYETLSGHIKVCLLYTSRCV